MAETKQKKEKKEKKSRKLASDFPRRKVTEAEIQIYKDYARCVGVNGFPVLFTLEHWKEICSLLKRPFQWGVCLAGAWNGPLKQKKARYPGTLWKIAPWLFSVFHANAEQMPADSSSSTKVVLESGSTLIPSEYRRYSWICGHSDCISPTCLVETIDYPELQMPALTDERIEQFQRYLQRRIERQYSVHSVAKGTPTLASKANPSSNGIFSKQGNTVTRTFAKFMLKYFRSEFTLEKDADGDTTMDAKKEKEDPTHGECTRNFWIGPRQYRPCVQLSDGKWYDAVSLMHGKELLLQTLNEEKINGIEERRICKYQYCVNPECYEPDELAIKYTQKKRSVEAEAIVFPQLDQLLSQASNSGSSSGNASTALVPSSAMDETEDKEEKKEDSDDESHEHALDISDSDLYVQSLEASDKQLQRLCLDAVLSALKEQDIDYHKCTKDLWKGEIDKGRNQPVVTKPFRLWVRCYLFLIKNPMPYLQFQSLSPIMQPTCNYRSCVCPDCVYYKAPKDWRELKQPTDAQLEQLRKWLELRGCYSPQLHCKEMLRKFLAFVGVNWTPGTCTTNHWAGSYSHRLQPVIGVPWLPDPPKPAPKKKKKEEDKKEADASGKDEKKDAPEKKRVFAVTVKRQISERIRLINVLPWLSGLLVPFSPTFTVAPEYTNPQCKFVQCVNPSCYNLW